MNTTNQDSEGSPPFGANLTEFSVTQLSSSLKRMIEDNFGYVRVKGEVSRVSKPASGHLYFDLKDDRSVLGAVVWKGVASRLNCKPEQGMEVICTGKITTYPGQSKYQMQVEQIEPAGIGALMAQLEERKKRLAAEGLFAPERKKAIPSLPNVIGVVTSPSGAVIRDILHRLADRFPRHVIIWPTPVQGEGAAEKIANAIDGFNRIDGSKNIPHPDVLIVARGGGSIEDLWCFNEEVVARATANSEIPIISAVGHETDTTLIDFVSDLRAPTPTAAAELAVPERAKLLSQVRDFDGRLLRAQSQIVTRRSERLRGLARGLPRPDEFLAIQQQRFDNIASRLANALRGQVDRQHTRLVEASAQLRPHTLRATIDMRRQRIDQLGTSMIRATQQRLDQNEQQLANLGKLLSSLSYQGVLTRGFVLVTDENGQPVTKKEKTSDGQTVTLTFQDGLTNATIGNSDPTPSSTKKPVKKKAKSGDDAQGTLL